MVDYYKILNLSLQKQNGKLTDEMVKRNYLAKRENYLRMKEKEEHLRAHDERQSLKLKKAKEGLNKFDSDEINEYFGGDYLTLLQDAYNAIKTEDSRKHYDELLKEMQKRKEQEKNNAIHKDMREEVKNINRNQMPQMQQMQRKPEQQLQQGSDNQQIQQKSKRKEIELIPLTRPTKQMNQGQTLSQPKPRKEIDLIPINRPKQQKGKEQQLKNQKLYHFKK